MEYRPAPPPTESKGSKIFRERIPLTPGLLLQLLSESEWNKAEVSRKSGYSRAAIWKYMKKWDIPLNRVPPS